jgi:hypothetical protein
MSMFEIFIFHLKSDIFSTLISKSQQVDLFLPESYMEMNFTWTISKHRLNMELSSLGRIIGKLGSSLESLKSKRSLYILVSHLSSLVYFSHSPQFYLEELLRLKSLCYYSQEVTELSSNLRPRSCLFHQSTRFQKSLSIQQLRSMEHSIQKLMDLLSHEKDCKQ